MINFELRPLVFFSSTLESLSLVDFLFFFFFVLPSDSVIFRLVRVCASMLVILRTEQNQRLRNHEANPIVIRSSLRCTYISTLDMQQTSSSSSSSPFQCNAQSKHMQ